MSGSTKIERDVVQMVFEAKQFRKGIHESIEDVETLKKSFDLTKARESLGQLEKSAHVDFSPMVKSLDKINGKIGLVGIAAATMVSNVTTAVMDGVKSLAGTLVFTPLKT
ncbi:MAG: hypothetical protein DRI46_12960, partial [Chloroflexi bacterium]